MGWKTRPPQSKITGSIDKLIVSVRALMSPSVLVM